MPYLGEVYGNPSSIHHVGRRARSLLDDARDRVARVWHCKPSEVIFTSGGTESNNLAILGTARQLQSKGRHIVTSLVEHHAVLHPCEYLRRHEGFEVTYLQTDTHGHVKVSDVAGALRPDTTLVSVMAANNEIGTVQPVAAIGALCRERGVLFHTDAVQCFGKESFTAIDQFQADLVSCCAHKFHGPKGAGALFIRSPLQPDPIIFGGGHENERRAGTENLPAIIGFAAATERFVRTPVFSPMPLRAKTARILTLLDSLSDLGVCFRGSRTGRLVNTIAFTVDGADSLTLLAALDLEGICASSGSACSAGSLEPSHVMLAIGAGVRASNALVRFSLGRETTDEEIAHVEQVLPGIITRARGD